MTAITFSDNYKNLIVYRLDYFPFYLTVTSQGCVAVILYRLL